MNKAAQLQSVWPKVHRMLKNPPAGVQLGNFPGMLPSMDKIKLDPSAEDPNALGFVTTEDIDGDGNIDVIHLSSAALAQALGRVGIGMDVLNKVDTLSAQELLPILSAFVEVISHELGHLQDVPHDYVHGEGEPFPGGEPVAEEASRRALQQVRLATTNIPDRFENSRSYTMNITNILKKLANDLDSLKAFQYADEVDQIMKSAQQSRAERSADNFHTDTVLEPGPGMENVRKVQQALLDMGFNIGSRTGAPDGDWGPQSRKAYGLFLDSYQSALENRGYDGETVEKKLMDIYPQSGGVDGLVRNMELAKNYIGLGEDAGPLREFPGNESYHNWKSMSEAEKSKWRSQHPNRYNSMIEFLKERKRLLAQMKERLSGPDITEQERDAAKKDFVIRYKLTPEEISALEGVPKTPDEVLGGGQIASPSPILPENRERGNLADTPQAPREQSIKPVDPAGLKQDLSGHMPTTSTVPKFDLADEPKTSSLKNMFSLPSTIGPFGRD
jgi:hypothetical protein